MSITSEIINSTKTGQAKALQKNAKTYADSLTQITKDQNKELKSTTKSLIEGTRQEVQRSYDLNALNEEIQAQQVSDRMASLGLTDSGLNLTQQTALASSRINADAQVSQSYNNAVATLRSNLQTAIAENNRTLQSNIAQVNYNTGVDVASITSQLKSDANQTTQSLVSSITSTTDKATQAQLIFSAASTYGLSNTSVNKLLSLTDITQAEYQSYLADKEYFSKKANSTGSGSSGTGGGKTGTSTGYDNGGFVDISAYDEKKASGAISKYSLFKYPNATEAMNRVDELLDEGIITDSVYASIIRQIGDYY